MKIASLTKTKLSTKTVVALVAGTVILAAAIAGGFSVKNGSRSGFFSNQAYAPNNQPHLELKFASAGYAKASPGDTGVNFGEYRLKAVGADALISDMNFVGLVQDVPASTAYAIGADGSVNFENRVTNCKVMNTTNGATISGPIFSPFPYASSGLQFDDDFTLSAGSALFLRVECDITNIAVNGPQDLFAQDGSLLSTISASNLATNAVMPLVVISSNGNPPGYYVSVR